METIRRWRGEFGSTPPFDTGPDTLVVGYSALGRNDVLPDTRLAVSGARLRSAHRVSGDHQHPAAVRARRETREAAQAPVDACCAYGIEGWESIDKPGMAKAIGEGRWREYGREAVFEYCEEDIRNSAELLCRQIAGHRHYAPVDPALVIRWSEYSAKTVARIQARGMPIDMALWDLVQENRMAVVAALIAPVRSQPGQRISDLFARWRVERLAV